MNIYDIAEKSGVSIATVSRVINNSPSVSEKTRAKVRRIMSESGYSPNIFARGLMINSIRTIGVLTADVQDLYHSSAIHAIEVEAKLQGYDTILCNTGEGLEDKRKYLRLLLDKRVDGIILIGSVFREKTDNSHIVEASLKVPVVMVNAYIPGGHIYSVICDDSKAVFSIVEYLVKKGYKKIFYIYDIESYSGLEKLSGYHKGMKKAGLSVNAIKAERGLHGGFLASGQLLAYIDKGSPAAVIASEDIIAAGLMKGFRNAGLRIPEDIAVAGFNNSVISLCTEPELTSVDSMVRKISKEAAGLLIKAVEGRQIPHKTVIKPKLVIRGST
ncbi:MAG: LacI family DNA-binding transcriptional regulator [Eubacteriales bacterium]|nr:LacI family DNA-binding transcriptional regulator [Eubacteriales bacterium]